MSATQRQPDGASSTNGVSAAKDTTPTSPTHARHGRARHTRTNASLTSSIGSTSAEAPFATGSIPRRTSVPNEATRIFQATGFDPLGTSPDTLFRSLNVKEVEAYEHAVRSTALGKQEELRHLVGQRYEDLLGTANTIIDMANSSNQLSQRLDELSKAIASAASAEEKGESSKKLSRRKSYLPTQRSPIVLDDDASSLHQEAIYVLGASLRLLMDMPEYVWKSIEKGKTLQAAWAFMLGRSTWSDLVDGSARSTAQSALQTSVEVGIASTLEAVSILRVNVRKTFPFIEKQWQSMQPMRKQIVHRAATLLSDAEIESMAVADQLAALMLIDGMKLDQALQLLLSQRLTAMRRMVKRRRTETSLKRATTGNGKLEGEEADKAVQASHTLAQVVNLFARTLQHAAQIFLLPPKVQGGSASSEPLLLDLLTTITDSSNFAAGSPVATSPSQECASLLSPADSITSRQSAAALRALRRRSSHGLPTSYSTKEMQNGPAAADTSHKGEGTTVRVSTVGVIQALPSARVLERLLPPSLWKFSPPIGLESQKIHLLDDLSSWSTKAREVLADGSSNSASAPDTLRSLLSELSDVGELVIVRRSLRLALQHARKLLSRKLAGPSGSTDKSRQEVLARSMSEMQKLEASMDAVVQERLLHLIKQKLNHAVQELLAETGIKVSKLQGKKSGADLKADTVNTPLHALFHAVESSDAASVDVQADKAVNSAQASRAFAASLQDHVCGRSQGIDRLASLYETPLSNLTEDLQVYQDELEADESFAGSTASIKSSFGDLLASSRAEVEKGLSGLLDQASSATSDASSVSMPTALVMRLIAVLTPTSKDNIRQPVKIALKRFWRPKVEQRISNLLCAENSEETASSTVSAPLVLALAILSDAIVQLGPALAGPELAQEARSILESVASKKTTNDDAEALKALLACDATGLSEHLSVHTSLHRVRLALSPLMLALATTASDSHKGGNDMTTMVLSRAEPVSATGQVQPIIALSRKKTGRFSSLPVR